MKKTLRLMGLCALAVLALVGCKKNEQTGSMTFKATISQLNGDAKTHIGIIGSDTMLVWNEGDQIKVYTNEKTSKLFLLESGVNSIAATFSGDLDESDSYTAFYPKDAEWNGTEFMLPLSNTQMYNENGFANEAYPMYATTTGTEFDFHSPCGILAIPLTGDATIGSIELTGKNINGDHEMLNGTYLFNPNDLSNPVLQGTNPETDNKITLNFSTPLALSATEAKVVCFVLPSGVFKGGFTAVVKNEQGVTLTTLSTIKNNEIKAQTIHLMGGKEVKPEGAIGGRFTIGIPGDQVWFSQGNLQYIGSAATSYWKFAEHQWDVFGENGQESAGEDKDRDLFGWGTSGWNNGNLYYQPYSIGQGSPDVAYGYGPKDGTSYELDLAGDYVESDWAWHNAISNGGNKNHTWRTLTSDEWDMVVNLRTASTVNGVENARFVKATVNAVNGVVLFPDVYTHPDGVTLPVSINEAGASVPFSSNVYNGDDWQAMEVAGAVFLPDSGSRYNPGYSGGSFGYWSTTHGIMIGDFHRAMLLNIGMMLSGNERMYGHAVRPIYDVDGSGAGTDSGITNLDIDNYGW